MDEGHRTSERRLNIFQGLCEILKVYRGIVQLVERWSPKPNVEGSSPSVPVADTEKQKCFSVFFICYSLLIICIQILIMLA